VFWVIDVMDLVVSGAKVFLEVAETDDVASVEKYFVVATTVVGSVE